MVALFYIVSFILALLASVGITGSPRFNLGWASVAFLALGLAVSSSGLMR